MKKTANMPDVLKTLRAVRAKRPPYDEFEARKPAMTETEIKKTIKDGIKREFPGIKVFPVLCGIIRVPHRVIVGAESGVPDLCGYLPDGRFLGIEVKAKKGTAQREQYDFAIHATRAGAVIIGAASWEECKKKLEEAIALPFEK